MSCSSSFQLRNEGGGGHIAEENNELVALSLLEITRNYMLYPASPYYVVLFRQRILMIRIDIQFNYLSVSSRLQVPVTAVGF